MISRLFLGPVPIRVLLGGALTRLDLHHLTTTIATAAWADMMSLLHLATLAARHQCWCGNEVMTAAIALVSAADSLFGKCTHRITPVSATMCGLLLRISPPRRRKVPEASPPRYPTIPAARRTAHQFHLRQLPLLSPVLGSLCRRSDSSAG